MNYGKINKTDIANGPGVRVSLFVSGCRNHCPGCFNPETWDFNYGERFTMRTIEEILEALSPDYIFGLSILGGDPFEPENSVGDWIDLRAAERVEMKKGDYYLIRLGVGMILPAGYEALVLPRSSTPNKFGIMLANSCGVIDNSYSGDTDEWRFPAVALRDTVIEKGDRIAQFRILENQPRITFETVPHLKNKSRGGIGSTGKR